MADDKSTIMERAQKYLQKGHLDKAAMEYKKIIEMDPQDATIRLRLGDLYVKMNKKDEAVKEYGEVAKWHSQKGFYLKAIAVYKQILKLDDTIYDIHFKLADLYFKQKLIADAMAEYSFLIGFLEKRNKADDVLELLKKMRELDPDNTGTRLKLADIWYSKGYKKEAYEEYDIVIKRMVAAGNIEKAEKVLNRLYESDSEEPKVLEGLVFIYRQKGDSARFMQACKEAADIYGKAGLIAKRDEMYRNVLEVSPDDKEAADIIGRGAEEKEEIGVGIEVPPTVSGSMPEEKAAAQVEETAEHEEPLIEFPTFSTEELKSEVRKEVKTIPEKTQEDAGLEVEIEIEEAEIVEELPLIEVEEVKEEETTPETREVVLSPEGVKEEILHETKVSAPEVSGIEKPEEEEFVDLSKELGMDESLDFLTESWRTSEGEGGNETFAEFKKGMQKQLSREDSETHYNLGIAYMEMGLYDDAIREFKIAIKDPARAFDCYARLGLSNVAKGELNDAIDYFNRGLDTEVRSPSERKGLMYELASTYEMAGDIQHAVEMFRSVEKIDPLFRGVKQKIEELSGITEDTYDIPRDDDIIEVEFL
ncbi:MAG: hypothetical protein A2073_05295 [Deltaproteobacteria bacterium GWC2_42_11]|nr:MAG: hypothetical protein A2073_05295 [Deltaproteobacteria bacterium GWC2_42_11]HBO85125.1 hypothetical protein [Deltaproteobacteria bacterium]